MYSFVFNTTQRVKIMLHSRPRRLKSPAVSSAILFGFLLLFCLNGAHGQTGMPSSDNGILFILDASGSMWGRVQKQSKIVVAKSVLRQLLSQIPQGTELGLIAYGHRQRSDCKDVETLLPLADNNHEVFTNAVESLTPRGKTPLTAAVTQATKLVAGRDDTPTVVVLSDGIESCTGNPCQAVLDARASGLRFTLHTIGFDLKDEETEQLKCMAEAGGGRFHTARNAGQLLQGLQKAVKAQAREVHQGIGAATQVHGKVFGTPSGLNRLALHTEDSVFADEILETGDQSWARILFLDDTRLNVGKNSQIKLDSFVYKDASSKQELSLSAVKGVFRFVSGKMKKNAYKFTTSTANLGVRGTDFITRVDDASRFWVLDGQVRISAVTGDQSRLVNAGESVSVKPDGTLKDEEFEIPVDPGLDLASGTLTLEATSRTGGGQVGPARILWSIVGSGNALVKDFTHDRRSLQLPAGSYTVTGTLDGQVQKKTVDLAENTDETVSFQFDITPVTLGAPDSVAMGKLAEITWQGPDNRNDYISVAEPDAPGHRYVNFAHTRKGSPAKLLMPDQPGLYEIRYVSGQSRDVLQRQPIEVTKVEATLETADEAAMGTSIDVVWSGPDSRNDFLSVAGTEDKDGKYINYSYTRKGNPASLLMPDKAGLYEIRYVSNQSKRVLARRSIKITEVQTALETPVTGSIGENIQVFWSGPDNKNDYITVIEPEARDNKYGNYVYTRKGNPLTLTLPDVPGNYEIRYVSNQSKTVLARNTIEVEAKPASLNALVLAPAGKPLRIYWEGPNGNRDHLTVAEPAQPAQKYIRHNRLKASPVEMKMPDQSGDYELRYISGQTRQVLHRRLISVAAEADYATAVESNPSATITLEAVSADGAAIGDDIQWSVYGIDGYNKAINKSGEARPAFDLKMGIYRANLSAGRKSTSVEFLVNPGEDAVQSVVLK